MTSRLTALAVGAASIAVAALGLAPPAAAAPDLAAGDPRLVVLGVAGLAWEDVTAVDMPTLYDLAGSDAAGSLTVRTVRSRTCVVDGWLTVNAGRRATDVFDSDADAVDDRHCRPVPAPVSSGDGTSLVPGWDALVATQDEQAYDTRLGLLGDHLADAGVCATAVGPGAGLALARADGSVASYRPTVAEVDRATMSECPLTVVDLGALPPAAPPGSEDAVEEAAEQTRRQVAAGIDQLIAAIIAELPENTALLVAGVADSAATAVPLPDAPSPIAPSALRVAAAAGPLPDGGEFGTHWLSSASTRWTGLVQLTDLASTILSYAGVDDPSEGTVGRPWRPSTPHPATSTETIAQLVGTDRAAQVFRTQSGPFFQILGVAQVLFFGGALLLLVRRSRHRERILSTVQIVALGAASFPVASFLANVARWWRVERADLVLWTTILGITVAVAAAALAGPWRQRIYGPPGVVAALTATVLAVDVSTGSNLQHSSLLGLSPLVAGRFYGFGNIPYAIFVASCLVAAAALAQWLIDSGRSRRTAALAAAAVGLVAVAVDGAPQAGADVGGILATIPGFVVLVLGVWGARVTVSRIALAGLGAAALFAVVAWLDWLRPTGSRTHFGNFFADVLSGDAWTVVGRKARASIGTLQRSPYYGWLVPVAYAAIGWLIRPGRSGGMADAVERWSVLRHLIWAGLLTGAVGFAVNDSGIIVPAILLTVGIPLLVSAIAAARREGIAVSDAATAPEPRAAHPV